MAISVTFALMLVRTDGDTKMDYRRQIKHHNKEYLKCLKFTETLVVGCPPYHRAYMKMAAHKAVIEKLEYLLQLIKDGEDND